MNTDNLKKLAECRESVNRILGKQQEMLQKVYSDPEYIDMEVALAAKREEINELMDVIKDEALDEFLKTGSKQMPGVTIKVMTRYVCTDKEAARKYALEKDQTLLLVDWKQLDTEAKQLHGTKYQFPFYKQTMEPQAQIKADLTEFLPEPQSSRMEQKS